MRSRFRVLELFPQASPDYLKWADAEYLTILKITSLLVLVVHPLNYFVLYRYGFENTHTLLNRVLSSVLFGIIALLAHQTAWGRRHVAELILAASLILFASVIGTVISAESAPIYVASSLLSILPASQVFLTVGHSLKVMIFSLLFYYCGNYFYPAVDHFNAGFQLVGAACFISIALNLIKVKMHINLFNYSQEILSQQAILAQARNLATIAEVANGAAHEINNPLAIISGNLNRMQYLLDKPDELKKRILSSLAAVERAAKIIVGLRNFSGDGFAEEKTDVPLPTIVQNCLNLCEERFKQKGVDLVIENVPDIMLHVRTAQMSQAILNLLTNSLGAVENTASPRVVLRASQAGGVVKIEVIDNGHGISPTIHDKIMQPFFTTKPVGKGAGLGLSATRGIVQDHGGKIDFQSSNDETTFSISLPNVFEKEC